MVVIGLEEFPRPDRNDPGPEPRTAHGAVGAAPAPQGDLIADASTFLETPGAPSARARGDAASRRPRVAAGETLCDRTGNTQRGEPTPVRDTALGLLRDGRQTAKEPHRSRW